MKVNDPERTGFLRAGGDGVTDFDRYAYQPGTETSKASPSGAAYAPR